MISAVESFDSIRRCPLDETLLLARRVIFGVFRQVAVAPRLGDPLMMLGRPRP